MTKACPSCSQINPPDAAFCLNCSAYIAPGRHPPQPPVAVQPPVPHTPVVPTDGSGQKATTALVLAISALLCCGPLTGIPAAIVGWMELDSIKNGRSPASGKGLATAGLWGGLAASVIHVVLYMIFVIFSAIGASTPYDY